MITKLDWDLNTRHIKLDKDIVLFLVQIDPQAPIRGFYHEKTRLQTELDLTLCEKEKDFFKFVDKAYKLLKKIKNITHIECDININPEIEDLLGNVTAYHYSCRFDFDIKE